MRRVVEEENENHVRATEAEYCSSKVVAEVADITLVAEEGAHGGVQVLK